MFRQEMTEEIAQLMASLSNTLNLTPEQTDDITSKFQDKTPFQALDITDKLIPAFQQNFTSTDDKYTITKVIIDLHAIQDRLMIEELKEQTRQNEILRAENQKQKNEIQYLSARLKHTNILVHALRKIIRKHENKDKSHSAKYLGRWRI